jgi:hypothetical protein
MRNIQGEGLYKDIVDAPSQTDPKVIVKLGVRLDTFQRYLKRGQRSAIAQYYGIVQEGLMLARHLFRGLKRPLMHNGDMRADQRVLLYTWRSPIDYEWAGTPNYGRPQPISPPPPNRVFVVLVREEVPDENEVVGSIEHWNWVREDPGLPHAPINWEDRYGSKLWSREL